MDALLPQAIEMNNSMVLRTKFLPDSNVNRAELVKMVGASVDLDISEPRLRQAFGR